ncbi:MAG: hypothetical protein MI757_05970 [Pirellulales bacterium]|nr:hypothetical protein [Pirellulales bacterium]
MRYINQDNGNTRDVIVDSIDANDSVEVGVLESGWVIEPNEIVTVWAEGYSSQDLYFYKNTKGEMIMTRGYAAKKSQQIAERVGNALK